MTASETGWLLDHGWMRLFPARKASQSWEKLVGVRLLVCPSTGQRPLGTCHYTETLPTSMSNCAGARLASSQELTHSRNASGNWKVLDCFSLVRVRQ